MPWLSCRNSADEGVKSVNESPQQPVKPSAEVVIDFIPAQIDSLCGTNPMHHKQTISQLLLNDLKVLARSITYVPAMMKASASLRLLRNSFKSPDQARNTVLQTFLVMTQIWMIITIVPATLLLPGFLSVTFWGLCWIVTFAITWPLRGPRVVLSSQSRLSVTEDFSDERWIYVNGVMCSHHSLHSQCDRISNIFGRSVIGIHNRTSGLVLDLIICFMQRCFNFTTPCTLTLGSQLRDACLTNSIRKVVVLSHSTGAVHVSIALDQLHATLPVDVLTKLEIYTFGSAASYLNNPRLRIDALSNKNDHAWSLSYMRPNGSIASPVKATLASLGHRIEDHERVIPHVEHYALASDPFAQFGILHSTWNVLDNRLCGRVFVVDNAAISRLNQGQNGSCGDGFLTSEYYLDLLFGKNSNTASDTLDQVVHVDDQTAEKREFTAQRVAFPQKAVNEHDNSPKSSPRSKISNLGVQSSRITSWETASVMGINGVTKVRAEARESEGKTVKQLSRLWRYAHGGRPIGEGVPLLNDVRHKLGVENMNGYRVREEWDHT